MPLKGSQGPLILRLRCKVMWMVTNDNNDYEPGPKFSFQVFQGFPYDRSEAITYYLRLGAFKNSQDFQYTDRQTVIYSERHIPVNIIIQFPRKEKKGLEYEKIEFVTLAAAHS